MRLAFLLAVLALLPQAGRAQHGDHATGRPDHAATPYAGFGQRAAAALGAEEVGDLRAGRGMGFALPAEVNGYPGPLHALELADRLSLSPMQRAGMEGLVVAMRSEAIPLGEALIAAERALDAVFRRGTATAEEVDRASAEAALARGRVRAAHLRVHLQARDVLTAEQRAGYARMRGHSP